MSVHGKKPAGRAVDSRLTGYLRFCKGAPRDDCAAPGSIESAPLFPNL